MTAHGTTLFIDSGLAAGQQAGLDVANFAAQDEDTPGPAQDAAGVAAGISAAAGVASAVFTGGNLGVNIANAVNNETTGQLQVNITNFSSLPVIVYDYNPTHADITDVPSPLAPGDNDLFVVTRSEPLDTTSALELDLLVGSGTASIAVSLTYSYTDNGVPGRWAVTTSVDGGNHAFPDNLQLFGLTFTGNAGYPSFSLYTSPIETSSGVMSIAIYDLA